MTSETIEAAFAAACLAELQALKPGNVHIHAAGHGMSVADFEKSAAAAAPWIAEPQASVGRRVLNAIRATQEAIGMNTNLGIVLLCAPLAAAAETAGHAGHSLRPALAGVLDALDIDDAEQVFEAIRLANPAGLGSRDDHDVRDPPRITLLEAMRLAASFDRVARAYTNVFEDIFSLGLPTLERAREQLGPGPWATAAVHLAFLASFPDSHVVRKHGQPAADALMQQARGLRAHPDSRAELLEFDATLKKSGLNPGTTADLTVATLFADTLHGKRL